MSNRQPEIRPFDFVCERMAGHYGPAATGPDRALEDREWECILRYADSHLMTPALWTFLRNPDGAELPEDVRRYLETVHSMNLERNSEILRQFHDAVAVLNACGTVPVALKGSAYLEEGVFEDNGTRIQADIDILVPASGAMDCQQALLDAGYREEPDPVPKPDGFRHLEPLVREGERVPIELHTEAADPPYNAVLGADEIIGAARLVESGGARFLVPSADHLALLSILHALVLDHGLHTCMIKLQFLHDMRALERHFGEAIDWTWIDGRMTGRELRRALDFGVEMLASCVSLSVPQPLRQPGRPSLRMRIARARIRSRAADEFVRRVDQLRAYRIHAVEGGPHGFFTLNFKRTVRAIEMCLGKIGVPVEDPARKAER